MRNIILKSIAIKLAVIGVALFSIGAYNYWYTAPIPERYVGFRPQTGEPITMLCGKIVESECGISLFNCENETVEYRCLNELVIVKVK